MVSAIAEKSAIVADQLRALTRLGDHYGLWDASRTDQAAAAAAELARVELAAADHEALVAELMAEYQISRELAEDLLADLDAQYAAEVAKGWSLTDELRSRILGAPVKPRVSSSRKDQLIHEALERAGLVEPDEPEPDPEPPPCGFRELDPPVPCTAPAPPPPPWHDEVSAAAIPTPEKPTGPPECQDDYHEMPGFGYIRIPRPTK